MIKTTSLELSRELVEAGVLIETDKSFFFSNGDTMMLSEIEADSIRNWSNLTDMKTSAPTACELLEVMPDELMIDDEIYFLLIRKDGEKFHVSYEDSDGTHLGEIPYKSSNLANELAKQAIWLKGQGLM